MPPWHYAPGYHAPHIVRRALLNVCGIILRLWNATGRQFDYDDGNCGDNATDVFLRGIRHTLQLA